MSVMLNEFEETQDICPSCQGRLSTSEGRTCNCVLIKGLKSYLPRLFSQVKVNRKFLEAVNSKGVPQYKLLETRDLLFWGRSEDEVMVSVKTWLSYKYIQTGGKYSYYMSSAYKLASILYGDLERRDNFEDEPVKGFTDLVGVDFLLITLGFDVRNTTYQDMLMSVMRERRLSSNRTWVHVAPGVTEIDFIDKYGNEVLNYIRKSGSFSSV